MGTVPHVSTSHPYDPFASLLDTAVAIVTLTNGSDHAGCLVGFHGQVSIEPRRHGVWISQENHTFTLTPDAVAAAVHLLGPDDMDLARRFGHETGDRVDKFDGIDHEPGPSGVRLLSALPHRIAGPCSGPFETDGDHVLLVVDPVEIGAAVGVEPRLEPLRLHDVSGIDPGHPD